MKLMRRDIGILRVADAIKEDLIAIAVRSEPIHYESSQTGITLKRLRTNTRLNQSDRRMLAEALRELATYLDK